MDLDEYPLIVYDPDMIGNQGEGLVITKFWGVVLNNQMYDGYEISTLVDVRDVRRGHHQLSFVAKPGNWLSYTMPLVPATFVEPADREAYEAKEKNVNVKQGHNTVRVAHDRLTLEQQRKIVRVEFPEGTMLSDVPFGSAPNRLRLTGATIPYTCSTGINAPDANNKVREVKALVCRMSWRMVDMGTAREVASDTHDEDADIIGSFAGLNFSSLPVASNNDYQPMQDEGQQDLGPFPAAPSIPPGYAHTFAVNGGPKVYVLVIGESMENSRLCGIYNTAYAAHQIQANAPHAMTLQEVFDSLIREALETDTRAEQQRAEEQRLEDERLLREEQRLQEEQRQQEEARSRREQTCQEQGSQPKALKENTANMESSRVRREQSLAAEKAHLEDRQSLYKAVDTASAKRQAKLKSKRRMQPQFGDRRNTERGGNAASSEGAVEQSNVFVFAAPAAGKPTTEDLEKAEAELNQGMKAASSNDTCSDQDSDAKSKGLDLGSDLGSDAFMDDLEKEFAADLEDLNASITSGFD